MGKIRSHKLAEQLGVDEDTVLELARLAGGKSFPPKAMLPEAVVRQIEDVAGVKNSRTRRPLRLPPSFGLLVVAPEGTLAFSRKHGGRPALLATWGPPTDTGEATLWVIPGTSDITNNSLRPEGFLVTPDDAGGTYHGTGLYLAAWANAVPVDDLWKVIQVVDVLGEPRLEAFQDYLREYGPDLLDHSS